MVGSRVYVGGLPFGVRDRDLEKFFKGFGRIRDILIKNGYGFVEFEDYRDADDAVYELNGKELLGERLWEVVCTVGVRGWGRAVLTVDRGCAAGDYSYRYGPPTRTEYRLVVENLSSRISWQDLKDYMRQAGEVTYADAHKQHRNEGVVEFATHSDMRAAIEKLDGTELNGRRIRLIEARRGSRRRTRSSSSRSRSRSRDRRRSRSRSRSRRSSRSRSRSKSRPKSKSPVAKSRSRSRSKDRSRSKSRSPSASRASDRRSASRRSDRRSASRRSDRRSASRRSDRRSASPRKSAERNGDKSASRSKSRSPKAASKERSRSRSKEASPKREEERRPSKSRSRSRSRSRSGSRDRSASRDRSGSRSRSGSPRQNGDAQDRASTDRSPRSGD
uniref:RRM domain-containing protein n=1 Tax=Heliothis virescens TaxID=7102 RepID=A0A2A4JUR4_HELVI